MLLILGVCSLLITAIISEKIKFINLIKFLVPKSLSQERAKVEYRPSNGGGVKVGRSRGLKVLWSEFNEEERCLTPLSPGCLWPHSYRGCSLRPRCWSAWLSTTLQTCREHTCSHTRTLRGTPVVAVETHSSRILRRSPFLKVRSPS